MSENKIRNEIEIKNLHKYFGKGNNQLHALKDINLNIEKGDVYGIIGASGAGKSTLVRSLNYLEKPSEGQVIVQGDDLGKLSSRELRKKRQDIAMIFQHFNLLMQKNVIDNVCFPMRLQGKSKKESKEKARELLKLVGLEDKERAYPANLSGGQKQRVAIARALAGNPQILLSDEATSALDPQTTKAILNLLLKINRELGITIVVITHQMSVIREICNRVAILDHGEIVEQGLVVDIFDHPKSDAAKNLIYNDGITVSSQTNELREEKKIRITFTSNSAYQPVIANMILKFQTPVNILGADTKNVSGIAKGEMILGLPNDTVIQEKMLEYLAENNLQIEEVI